MVGRSVVWHIKSNEVLRGFILKKTKHTEKDTWSVGGIIGLAVLIVFMISTLLLKAIDPNRGGGARHLIDLFS